VAADPLISVSIMAHPKREQWIPTLVDKIDADVTVVWDRHNDRWDTGRRSLLAYHKDATHHLVVQDDALVCRDLVAGLTVAATHSKDHPVGLYTGNIRPQHAAVARQLAAAREQGSAWWHGEGPWWGVGIMLPTKHIPGLLRWADRQTHVANYDMRISRWYRRRQLDCWYTVPSLVNHRHGPTNPSLVAGRTALNRRARWFIGESRSALSVRWGELPKGGRK
jgi:hypothetical protein